MTPNWRGEVTEPSELVTAVEAAERLGVTKNTVVSWLLRGYLQGTQDAPRRGWRIPASDVDRLAREREE
jgi:excisionase family DNA binding protein